MSESKLSKTPLHSCHLKLGARMVPFAGYDMPVQYTGVIEETEAVRATGGLFDVSHMGQFSIRSPKGLQALSKLVTNDLSKLAIGQAQYNMLCNESGGVIDDLVIYRRADDHVYICVNASNRAEDFDWMRSQLPKEIPLEDESEDTALIALQGPIAEQLLGQLAKGEDVSSIQYYWAREGKVLGHTSYISRTGYTGEDGFELYVDKANAIEIWETLLEKGRALGLKACGLGARDTVRLEMGYPLHGHELSKDISPLEANLGWVVKLEKEGGFIGQAALKKESIEGSKQKLRPFVLLDRRIPRQNYPLANKEGVRIGYVTSGTHSPHRKAPLGMGFVNREFADSKELFVEVRETLVAAEITKLPFVSPKVKKK